MIYLSQLELFLVTCLPALVSIVSIISAVVTIIRNLNELRDHKSLQAERDALAEQNAILLAESRKQRKLMALYIEKAVKVKYGDLTEVQNDEDLKV